MFVFDNTASLCKIPSFLMNVIKLLSVQLVEMSVLFSKLLRQHIVANARADSVLQTVSGMMKIKKTVIILTLRCSGQNPVLCSRATICSLSRLSRRKKQCAFSTASNR